MKQTSHTATPRSPFGLFCQIGQPGDWYVIPANKEANVYTWAQKFGRIITTERVILVRGTRANPVASTAVIATIVQ